MGAPDSSSSVLSISPEDLNLSEEALEKLSKSALSFLEEGEEEEKEEEEEEQNEQKGEQGEEQQDLNMMETEKKGVEMTLEGKQNNDRQGKERASENEEKEEKEEKEKQEKQEKQEKEEKEEKESHQEKEEEKRTINSPITLPVTHFPRQQQEQQQQQQQKLPRRNMAMEKLDNIEYHLRNRIASLYNKRQSLKTDLERDERVLCRGFAYGDYTTPMDRLEEDEDEDEDEEEEEEQQEEEEEEVDEDEEDEEEEEDLTLTEEEKKECEAEKTRKKMIRDRMRRARKAKRRRDMEMRNFRRRKAREQRQLEKEAEKRKKKNKKKTIIEDYFDTRSFLPFPLLSLVEGMGAVRDGNYEGDYVYLYRRGIQPSPEQLTEEVLGLARILVGDKTVSVKDMSKEEIRAFKKSRVKGVKNIAELERSMLNSGAMSSASSSFGSSFGSFSSSSVGTFPFLPGFPFPSASFPSSSSVGTSPFLPGFPFPSASFPSSSSSSSSSSMF